MKKCICIIAIIVIMVLLIWLDKTVFDGIVNSGMPNYLKYILLR